jgi:hypothetical protein
MPLLGPTTFSVEDPIHTWAITLETMYTALSLPADDASMLVVRHFTNMLRQKTPRPEA